MLSPVLASVPQVPFAHAEAHFAHLQPTRPTTADAPTSTYTTDSIIGIPPKSKLTIFRFIPINIPTPTKPQFSPPTISNMLATLATKQTPPPHFILQHIFFVFLLS